MPSPAERMAAHKSRKPTAPAGRKVVWVCRIREVRTGLKPPLSLRDVEKGTGLDSGHVSQIENGTELTLGNARVLAKFFGKTVEELWPRRCDGE